jgi:hypothetical protein
MPGERCSRPAPGALSAAVGTRRYPRAVPKKTKDPIKKLLAECTPTLFMGNPAGTVAIMEDKVVDAGGDPEEVLAWVREHGGFPDKTFPVNTRHGLSPKPKQAAKRFFVVPEDTLK